MAGKKEVSRKPKGWKVGYQGRTKEERDSYMDGWAYTREVHIYSYSDLPNSLRVLIEDKIFKDPWFCQELKIIEAKLRMVKKEILANEYKGVKIKIDKKILIGTDRYQVYAKVIGKVSTYAKERKYEHKIAFRENESYLAHLAINAIYTKAPETDITTAQVIGITLLGATLFAGLFLFLLSVLGAL